MQSEIEKPIALRPRDAAKLLRISERTLWERTRDGLIPHKVMSDGKRKTVRYSRAVLEHWMESNDAEKSA